MYTHLRRQGYDVKNVYTKFKLRGVYKRNELKAKKIRTKNGERRALYDYSKISAFEHLQYDTKKVSDKHALPPDIYDKFKNSDIYPEHQWTITDAKTKTRFLAWSYTLSSTFGKAFLDLVISWIRAHNITYEINVQMDGGAEFFSASVKKLAEWQEHFNMHNTKVLWTGGTHWKQNLVERTHRIDDEEFYCPRGNFMKDKDSFSVEAQRWIWYYNLERPSSGIGMNGRSPCEKLESLGMHQARRISKFPMLILEDFFESCAELIDPESAQNVLTHYYWTIAYP